jgi:diguanylate cyclase (GGDEF)-like protein/PAS domain S-box-containing protein
MAVIDFEMYDLGLASGFIETAPDAVVIFDAEGVIIMVNAQSEELFGYPRESLLGQHVEMLVPELLRSLDRAHRANLLEDPSNREARDGIDTHGVHSDGTEFSVEISIGSLETKRGTLFTSFIRDVSERRRLEVEAAHFRSVVESSQDAIIGKNLDGIIVSWNGGAQRLYGYAAHEVIGRSTSILVPLHYENPLPDILRRVRSGEVIENLETVRSRKDGTQVTVSLTVSPIRTLSGEVTGASTIARNITERVRYQEQLIAMSERDALTGLRNRRRFERDIADQVERAHRYGEHAVLMMIDLNGFKKINDLHGHKVGDQVLKAVAAALRGRLRDSDMVARIGGDEFAIVMPYARVDNAQGIADGLKTLINACTVDVVGSPRIKLGASIGLVEIDQETASEEDIIAEADRLMYKEKANDPSRLPRE